LGLEQLTLETGLNKVEVAIELLRAWEPPDGYYLAFSGGKDSVAIYDLATKAGVKFDAHYCVSPIDPPQIYKFIKEHYPDVIWDYHAKGFWQTVVEKGLPRRQGRWCCQIIKEAGGIGRVVIVGNRRSEGTVRKNQKCFDHHRTKDKRFLRPILNFDDYDIWQYIKEKKLPYCSLYDEGFKRLGCVLCPFTRDTEREMAYFPKIVECWKRASSHIVEKRLASGKEYSRQFKTGEELFNWWISRK
jgi:phosphoadenosine phosphosulfate reductase